MVVSTAYDAGHEPDPASTLVDLCVMGTFGFIAYMAARRAQQKHLDI